jgi:PPOX class probable F420-dependent enzyme
MNLETLPGWARELLEAARVGHLGLLDDAARPRVLPVVFTAFEGALWSAVDQKPKRVPGEELARVRWLHERPEASLCVDRYDDDWSRLAWVQVLGTVEVLDADAGAGALGALADKYEQYRDERPAGPLLRLVPERAIYWRATGNPRRDHSLQPPG